MLQSPTECTFMPMRPGDRGWHFHSYNDDVDSIELMAPTYATAYAQLAADDEVVAYSASTDTQIMTVYGINSEGRKAKENIQIAGTSKVSGLITFSYIEDIRLNLVSANKLSLSRDNSATYTYIMEVEAATLGHPVAQHFNGECESYITYFAGGTYDAGNDLMLELRWYPDDDASRGTSGKTGYEVLDRIQSPTEALNIAPHVYPSPIGPLPKGGWIVVYGVGDNTKGWVTVQGFDVEVPA